MSYLSLHLLVVIKPKSVVFHDLGTSSSNITRSNLENFSYESTVLYSTRCVTVNEI